MQELLLLAADEVAERELCLGQSIDSFLLQRGFTVLRRSVGRNWVGRQVRNAEVAFCIIGASKQRPEDAIRLVAQIREANPKMPIVLLAAATHLDVAVAALRAGVNDYLKCPLDLGELSAAMDRLLHKSGASSTVPSAARAAPMIDEVLIGASPAIRNLRTYLPKLAATDACVLLTGETGTGKDLTAELIHANSVRRAKPFVCINCAAIPDALVESELFGYERGAFTGADAKNEGKLHVARGGTLFFDEIGDMSLTAQAKILRAIESKEIQRLGGKAGIPVDIRVISATNCDLERLVTEARFRRDLFFRLNVCRAHLPPLRERIEDIPLLLNHFVNQLNRRFEGNVEGLTEEVLEYLLSYHWPGNVRELKNLVETMFVSRSSGTFTIEELPEQFRKHVVKSQAISAADERTHLLVTLSANNWNKTKTARKLNWSRMTLYRKLAKYNILKTGKLPQGNTERKGVTLSQTV
jgi:DNA-binding NtrC family response regulator